MMIFEPLIQNIVLLSIFYIIGSIYNFFVPVEDPKPFKSVFYKLLHGAIFSVIITAVIFTHFQTVMLGLLIPVASLILIRKDNRIRNFNFTNFFNKEDLFPLLCAVLAAAAILGYRSFFTNDIYGFIIQHNADTIFYSKVTDYLWQKGIETISLEYFSNPGATPYHYFELWINVILRVVFGRNDSSIFVSVIYTSLLVIAFIGLISLSELWARAYLLIITAFSFLFLGGLYFDAYGNWKYMAYSANLAFSTQYVPKHSVVLIFLIYCSHFFIYRKNHEAMIALLFLPIAYFTTSPAIFAALICIILFKLAKGACLEERNFRIFMATWLSTLLYLILFYYINLDKDSQLAGNTLILIQEYLNDWNYYKTIVNILIGTSIHIALLYLAIFVGLANLYGEIKGSGNESLKDLLFCVTLIVLLLFFGLLSWGILHFSITTVQFFSNLGIPMLVLILFLLITHSLRKSQIGFLKIVLLLLVVTQISFTFWREVQKKHSELLRSSTSISSGFIDEFHSTVSEFNPIGAFLKSKDSYKSMDLHHLVETTYSLDLLLHTDKSNIPFHTVSLSSIYIDSESYGPRLGIVENMKKSSAMCKYIEKLHKQNKFLSIEESQLSFCLEHGIEYILVEGSAKLPEVFYDWFELKTTDEISKMQLYVIKEI